MERLMLETEGIQSNMLPEEYDPVKMYSKPEFAKLAVVRSAKELIKHIKNIYPACETYAGIISRLDKISKADTFTQRAIN